MRLLQLRLQHIHARGQQPNYISIKTLINFLLGSIIINLQILTSTLCYVPLLLHCDEIYSAKRKFRSTSIPRSFCFSLSLILLLATFSHNNLCLFPDIRSLYFSSFNFMQLASNRLNHLNHSNNYSYSLNTIQLRNLGFPEILDPNPCFLHLQHATSTTFGVEQVLSRHM